MKRLSLLLFALWMGGAVLAQQQEAAVPYSEQYVRLYQIFAREPGNVSNLIDMALFFSKADNPQCNYPQAYSYITTAETLFSDLVQDNSRYRDAQKVLRKGISIGLIRQHKSDIEAAAMAYLRAHIAEMVPAERKAFADAFPDNAEMLSLMRNRALSVEYAQVCRENTIQAYYDFCKAHPRTYEADSAEAAIARLAPRLMASYADEAAIDSVAARFSGSQAVQHAAMRQKSRAAYFLASQTNTIEAYSSYLERFPRGDNYLDALAQVQTLRGSDYAAMTSPYELADYIDANNDSPLSDSALARLRHLILDDHNQAAARIYLSRYPLDEYHSAVYKNYYSWYAAEGNRGPIARFAEENPDYPYQMALKSDLSRGAMIDTFDLTKPYQEADFESMSACLHHLTGRKVAYVALQRLLQRQIAAKEWGKAHERMQQFDLCFEEESVAEYNELATLLTAPSATASTLVLPAGNLSYVLPHPTAKMLYYTRASSTGNTIEYLRFADGKKGGWKHGGTVYVQGISGRESDMARDLVAYNFYSNGNKVLLGMGGDIWSALVVNDTLWRLADRLPAPVNTAFIDKDAYFLPDGSGLLLASDRPGGRNVQPSGSYFHGDSALATDIYYIPYLNGRWDDAVNLGGQVNTAYCEASPLLSRNLRTLYFITDARGMGYGDVYCVTRTDVDDWTHWSAPINLGRNVNGAFRERSLAFSDNEKQIFLTTNSPQGGQNACYSFATHHDTASAIRSVTVRVDSVMDYLRALDLVPLNGQQVLQHTDWGADSAMAYRLYKDKEYVVMAQADWLYVPALYIDGHTRGPLSLTGYSLDSLRRSQTLLPLRLVRFVGSTARLLPMAEKELKNLVAYMRQHANANIEVTVNVNGRDDKACYDLSMARAMAIRTFLVANDIDADRIHLAAYGNHAYKGEGHPAEVCLRFL